MTNTNNKSILTVYVDMDGVLADFNKKTIELIGKTLAEFNTSAEAWTAMEKHKDIYALLEPTPDAYELVERLQILQGIYGFRLEILSAIPKVGQIPTAKQDKRRWLDKYFDYAFQAFNIGPHAEHKQYHCVAGDVLIDDSEMNIPQWNSREGFGILHTSAKDSLVKLEAYLKCGVSVQWLAR